jgi:ABC-type uncharacterized transport system ATPase subunit
MFSGWWCNNLLEKYELVNGKDDIPYMKWNKQMLETTNQMNICNHKPVVVISLVQKMVATLILYDNPVNRSCG